jgi:hypothetical protein
MVFYFIFFLFDSFFIKIFVFKEGNSQLMLTGSVSSFSQSQSQQQQQQQQSSSTYAPQAYGFSI